MFQRAGLEATGGRLFGRSSQMNLRVKRTNYESCLAAEESAQEVDSFWDRAATSFLRSSVWVCWYIETMTNATHMQYFHAEPVSPAARWE